MPTPRKILEAVNDARLALANGKPAVADDVLLDLQESMLDDGVATDDDKVWLEAWCAMAQGRQEAEYCSQSADQCLRDLKTRGERMKS